MEREASPYEGACGKGHSGMDGDRWRSCRQTAASDCPSTPHNHVIKCEGANVSDTLPVASLVRPPIAMADTSTTPPKADRKKLLDLVMGNNHSNMPIWPIAVG